MLVATGAFWAYHLRVVQRDRAIVPETGAAATIRRWCVYGLAFVGLMMLLFGTAGLLARLIDLAVPDRRLSPPTPAAGWRWTWPDGSHRSLTGLLVWVTRLGLEPAPRSAGPPTPDPERDSVLRKVYLYGVLLIAVSWTVWSVAPGALRPAAVDPDPVPGGGALECGPARSRRDGRERPGLRDRLGVPRACREAGGGQRRRSGIVRRRSAGSTATSWRWSAPSRSAVGLGGTLATLLDLLVNPGVTRGEHWWEERLSLFATMIVVGLPVWLIPWFRLQREVVASVARRSLARRIYLFLVLGITVLTLLGSGAYTLYQILRVALGERWTAGNTSDLIDAASAAHRRWPDAGVPPAGLPA